MLEVMDCFFCGKYYRAEQFEQVVLKLPYADNPVNKSIQVPICKGCYSILERGEAMNPQQPGESTIEDIVRDIVQEETEID